MLDSLAFKSKLRCVALSMGAVLFAATAAACGGESGAGQSNVGGSGGQGGGHEGAGGQGGSSSTGQGQGGQGGGGVVDPNLVPMFVAQGHAGRTIISCDDGMTWVGNRSDDDSYPCFSSQTYDCDHHSGAGRGIDYGNGYFVATFGWGKPGSIRRSKNGVDWEHVLDGKTFAGIAFDGAGFLAGERPPQVSDGSGATWTPGGDLDSSVWNARRTGFAAHDGGRFLIAFGDNTGNDINVSKDRGASWARPTSLPAACAGDIQWSGGFAYGNGVIVVLGGTGVACRSLDGGDTWTESAIGAGGDVVDGRLLWTGSEFVTWGRDASYASMRYTSADGAAWSMTPTVTRKAGGADTGPGPLIGAVTRGDTGTYVAVNGNWDQWYEKQHFYRSTDGVTWDELPAGAFVGSHPVQFIVYGLGEKSPVCP